MKRLFLILGTSIIISSFIIGAFYHRLSPKYAAQNVISKTFDYLMNSNDTNEIIFVGASTTLVEMNPAIIKKITGLSCRNIALDGSVITQTCMSVKKYLQRHTAPKVVVFGIAFTSLNTDKNPYNFPDYFPYLKDSLIYNSLVPYEKIFRYKFMEPFYLFQRLISTPDGDKIGFIINRFGDNRSKGKDKNQVNEYGYWPIDRHWSKSDERKMHEKVSVFATPLGYSLLDTLIGVCKNNNSQLVLVYSPFYYGYSDLVPGSETIMNNIKMIADKNEISYLDYSSMEMCKNRRYFYNYTHLNSGGADIFSNQLGRDIDSLIRYKRSRS